MLKGKIAWVLLSGLWFAAPAAADEPASLRELMQELGTRMDRISDGIWREDYRRIAAAARYIAEHPKPPLEQRKKIMALLGPDAAEFRAADGRVHDGALALVEAARSEQMPPVLKRYQELVEGCVACHATFRSRLRPVLHPE